MKISPNYGEGVGGDSKTQLNTLIGSTYVAMHNYNTTVGAFCQLLFLLRITNFAHLCIHLYEKRMLHCSSGLHNALLKNLSLIISVPYKQIV